MKLRLSSEIKSEKARKSCTYGTHSGADRPASRQAKDELKGMTAAERYIILNSTLKTKNFFSILSSSVHYGHLNLLSCSTVSDGGAKMHKSYGVKMYDSVYLKKVRSISIRKSL